MRVSGFALLAVLALSTVSQTHAQVVSIGGLPSLPPVTRPVTGALGGALDEPLSRTSLEHVRRLQVRELLRTERLRVDVDVRGEPVLRSEFLVIAPTEATLDAVRAAGFEVAARADEGAELGLEIVLLRDTRGRGARRALRELRRVAPEGEFAHQHLYLSAGIAGTGVREAQAGTPASVRVGLIDGGVDASHPALAGVRVERFGCNGRAIPQAHGTVVATRLAGGAQGTLYAADLWCGDRVGRATLGLVEALGWMARERVPVINISLVGPDNAVLAHVVQALVARGHVVIAAVGNDGPAAPPLYPAAYAGVIGVSGVDAKLRVLPESGSGPHVDYSAPGVVDRGTRGTSFAAPLVARAAATMVRQPAPDAQAVARRLLSAQARDLGRPGRDPRYGDGVIGGS